jgi:hypothetical protein
MMSLEEVKNFYMENNLITDLLPITLGNGMTFNKTECSCSACGRNISEIARGTINFVLKKEVAQIKGVTYCQKCDSLSIFEFRVRGSEPNIISHEFINNEGQWMKRVYESKISFFNKIKKYILKYLY